MTQAIKETFKLALAQLNAVVGDLEGNLTKAREARARVRSGRGPDRLYRTFPDRLPH